MKTTKTSNIDRENKAINESEMVSAKDKQKAKSKIVRRQEREAMKAARVDLKQTSKLLLEAMAQAFPPEKIQEHLKELATASIITKGGNERPDYRTRMEALKMIYSYSVGTPIQRQEQVNYNLDVNDMSEKELVDLLSRSPSMMKKVQDIFDEAKKLAAEVTDIEEV